MDSTLAIILKAQDQMSGAFKAATGAAQGLDTATTEAGDALQVAGAQAEKNAEATEGASAASAALMAALEKLIDSTSQSAASLKTMEERLKEVDEKQDGAGDSAERLAEKQKKAGKEAHNSAAAFLKSQLTLEGLKKVMELAANGLNDLAEHGNKNAAAMIQAFDNTKKAVERLLASILTQLAPVFGPLSNAFSGVANAMADYISKSNTYRQATRFIVDGLALLMKALDFGIIGARGIAAAFSVSFQNMVAVAELAFAKIVRALSYVVESAIGPAMLVSRELGNQFAETSVKMDRFASRAEKNAKSWVQTTISIDTTSTAIGKAGDALLAYAEGGGTASDKVTNQLAADWKKQSEGAKKAAQAQADAQKKLQEQMKTTREEERAAFEEDTAIALKRAGDSNAQKIAILRASLGEAIALYGEHSAKVAEIEIQIDEATKTLTEEREKVRKDTETKRGEAIQIALDERLQAIELENLTEEEAAAKKIALYQAVAAAFVQGSEQQRTATKAVVDEQIKLGQIMASKWKETAHASASAFTGMLDTMLKGGTTLKEKLKAVFSQVTDMMLANFQKQQDAAIEAANKSVAAGEAGSVREALAAQKGIIPKILSAAASLPFPASAIAAGLAMAAFKALMNKAASFFEFGGPVESGNVGGFGRRDSVPAQLTPGEFVLRPEAVRGIGRETLERANQTGQLPAGGGGSMVLNAHFTIEAGRGVVLMPQQVAQEVGPYIADTLNTWVKNHGGILYASDLLVSLPQPAGA